MSIEAIGRLIERAADKACAAGIPARVVAPILMRAEAELINALLDEHRALLRDCRTKGVVAVAKGRQVHASTVWRWRQAAFDAIGKVAQKN